MKRLIISTLTITAVLATGSAFAGCQGQRGGDGMTLDRFDKDSSGTISEEEFNQTRAEHMAKMAEMGRPMRNAGNAPQFADIDTNKDGEVDSSEFAAARDARRAERQKRRDERQAQRGERRQQMQSRRNQGQHSMGRSPQHSFEDLDLDKDGMISPEEFAKHHAGK